MNWIKMESWMEDEIHFISIQKRRQWKRETKYIIEHVIILCYVYLIDTPTQKQMEITFAVRRVPKFNIALCRHSVNSTV